MKDVCKSRKLKENFGSINFKRVTGCLLSCSYGLFAQVLAGCEAQPDTGVDSEYITALQIH